MIKLTFPADPRRWWVFERDVVAFPALLNDKRLVCLVSMELLMERFGLAADHSGDGQEALRIFDENQEVIREAVGRQLAAGRVGPNDEVLVDCRTFRLGSLVVSESIQSHRRTAAQIMRATWILESILGPYSHEVAADWSQIEELEIVLQLTDTLMDYSVIDQFNLDELGSDGKLRYRLSKLWGDLLEARSHRQLQELVVSQEAGE